MSYMVCLLISSGVRVEIEGRFIGIIGVICVYQKVKEEWGFEI